MKPKISSFNILILSATFYCSAIGQSNNEKLYCNLINDVITNKELDKLIQIESAREDDRGIRIIDLTNKFKNCSGYILKNDSTLVRYYVFNELKPTLNTGIFRDIVFKEFRKVKKNEFDLVVIICSFNSYRNENPCQIFQVKLQKYPEKYEIREVNTWPYEDPLPDPWYYDKN